MVYDEGVAFRISELLSERYDLIEKKMFGGIAYMVNGNMSCGIIGEDLMVRVAKENYEQYLEKEFVREMDFTGRSLKGMIYVSPGGIEEDEDLDYWVNAGIEYANSLPPK